MIVPYKKNKIIDEEYHFKRNIPHGLKIEVEKGIKVKKDSILASGEMAEEKSRMDISSLLKVKPIDVKKHLTCLNGERVKKGEVIALIKKGVVSKEKSILAPNSGVINLSEVSSGILKILSVAKEGTVNAGIEGEVISVIKNKQVDILCEVLKVHSFVCFGENVQGELFFLNNPSMMNVSKDNKPIKMDESMIVEDEVEIGSNLKGGIVVLNFKPNFEFIRKLALSGVIGLVLGSIDSNFLKDISSKGLYGISLCILEGYGDVSIDRNFLQILKRNDGFLCFIDVKKQELVFTNTKGVEDSLGMTNFVKKLEIGDRVQVFDRRFWGVYGDVKEITPEIISVKCDKNKTVEVSANNLLVIG